MPTISELRRLYVDEERPLPRALEQRLRDDPRAGVQSVLESVRTRRARNHAEGRRLSRLLRYEQRWWEQGLDRVAGVDEVGVCPLAGPLVAAAVVLPVGHRIVQVDDSKKLDAPTRERLAEVIRAEAICWAIGVVEVDEIDNVYHASLRAMRRAVLALDPQPEVVLVDARRLSDLSIPQERIVHGDALSLAIAAGSILAKTWRDARMVEYDARWPMYGFARHKGYPVAEHRAALRRYGPCEIHRRCCAIVRDTEDVAAEPGRGV